MALPGSASLVRGGLIVAGCLSLGACSGWFGDTAAPPIPGDRRAVLDSGEGLSADPDMASVAFNLPAASFDGWAQDGGNVQHDPQRLAGTGALNVIWSVDTGSGSDSESRLLVQPVVADARIFTLDTEGVLAAFSTAGGGKLWELEVLPEDEDEGDLGGGIAVANGTLYVTTGAAEALAIEPANGAVIWRSALPGPSRAAPTIAAGRVFAVTADNRTVALDSSTGERLWSHSGAADEAGLLGAASPVVDGSVVVVPYISGEVYAMRVENGRVLWSDRLVAPRRTDAIARIAQIRARPIISDNTLFVVSHSGRTAALDMRTGSRVWEQNAGGASSPWLASGFLFVINDRSQVVALSASDGRVRWVTELAAYEDPEDRTDPIDWVGPILVGDRLLVASSTGYIAAVSPATGEILAEREIAGAPIRIEPMAAGGTVYILADDARLYALR